MMNEYKGTIKCEKCEAELDVYGSLSEDMTFTLEHSSKTHHVLNVEPMSAKADPVSSFKEA